MKELEVFGTLGYHFMYCALFQRIITIIEVGLDYRTLVPCGLMHSALWSVDANPVNPAAQESFLFVAENERVGGRVC